MYWENIPIIICDHNYANDKSAGECDHGTRHGRHVKRTGVYISF